MTPLFCTTVVLQIHKICHWPCNFEQSWDSNLAWLNGLSNSFLCAQLSSLLFYFISLHSCIDVLFLGALAFCISVYFISSSVSFLLAFLFVSLFLSLSFLSHRHTLASKQQLSSEMKWCVDWDIISPRFIWSPLTLVASALNSRSNILTIIASSPKGAETPSSPASTSYQSHLFVCPAPLRNSQLKFLAF